LRSEWIQLTNLKLHKKNDLTTTSCTMQIKNEGWSLITVNDKKNKKDNEKKQCALAMESLKR